MDNKYVSGSQYMTDGELDVSSNVPAEVIDAANDLAITDYFANIFDFVIDIGETKDGLKIVEINAFETASFYNADLDAIYSTWANASK